MAELEAEDIQGLVFSGYGHLPCATYLLLRVSDDRLARSWLAHLADEITTSVGRQDGTSLNVAFTYPGLEQLRLDAQTLASFARPFLEGMATPHRSRILGDADENAPPQWNWGGSDQSKRVDILLLLFAADEATLDASLQEQRSRFAAGGLAESLALAAGRQPDSHEHFGFADGIAQPVIEGSPQVDRAASRNVIKTGEILLSHANDYGKPADSPMVDPALDPRHLLIDAPAIEGTISAQSARRDLGRNGTYLVFRQLAQHVADFWQFLDGASSQSDGEFDRAASCRLAAKLVGRWPSGAPLVLVPDADNPGLGKEDNFGYREMDAHGFACPLGSHIRRSNPRDSLGPDAKAALASANRHRLLRRGRSYGPRLADSRVDDGAERGLHFICLNGDIERQFEFVQQTWINNPVFGGLNGEVDPLVGYLDKGDGIMTVPADPLRTRLHNLRRFVTVKGGAYFFLPSLRAIRYLSSLLGDEEPTAGLSA